MAAARNRRHLIVRRQPVAEPYTPHGKAIPPRQIPVPRNRAYHATRLKAALLRADRDVKKEREEQGVTVHGAEPGLYVQFESQPGVELKLESLEDRVSGIELVAVQDVERGSHKVQLATVFIPDGKLKRFVKKIEDYASKKTAKGVPRHKDLIDRITALQRATLRALWTDTDDTWPAETETIWWEVWLRRHDGEELARLSTSPASSTSLLVSAGWRSSIGSWSSSARSLLSLRRRWRCQTTWPRCAARRRPPASSRA